MNRNESLLISRLRFPMTLAVVAQHCMGAALIAWDTLGTKDIPGLVKTLISGCAVQVAVPVFFFISGFLFFQGVTKMNTESYFRKISRRWHSLIIPYILWSLLSIPLLALTMYGETLTGTSTMADLHDFWHGLSVKGVFWSYQESPYPFPNLFGWPLLYASPVLGPFWFVRDLIIVSLLSPLVWWFVTKTKRWGLALLAAVYLLRIWPYTAVNSQILFFVFGAYWSLNGWGLTFQKASLRWLTYGTALLLLVVLVRLEGNATYWGFQLMPSFTILGTAAVMNLGSLSHRPSLTSLPPSLKGEEEPLQRERESNIGRWLSKSSFFVFALHMNFALPLGFFVTKAVFRGATGWAAATLQYLLTPLVIYAICLGVYAAMERLTPRFLNVLTGDRVKTR